MPVLGAMIESNLVAGKQPFPPAANGSLRYGQSITDACLGWDATVPVIAELAAAVRARRR